MTTHLRSHASTLLLTAAAVVIFAAVTFGQVCPPQAYPTWQPDGYGIDPNEIALDPDSGERLWLGTTVAVVGKTVTIQGWACDPEGDAFSLVASAGVLTQGVGAEVVTYQIVYTPTSAGLHYVHVSALDALGAVRTGTHVVVARMNTAPTLCGGRP